MAAETLERSTPCPCCGANIEGPPAFVHEAVPLLLNVLAAADQGARTAATGRLELYECPRCGLVFNRAFAGVPYGRDYFVDATLSPRYRRHMDDVVDRLAARVAGRTPFSVVDVGAGQGTFLAHLAARLGDRLAHAHGFDPAFRPSETRLPANIGFTASMLDAERAAALDFPVDVVVTRHVLEHVIDPVRFLSSFREHFAAPFTLVVETPNVAHTLERGLLHDFCYEHCAMATDAALSEALRRSGYEQIQIESAFGGEYLLAIAVAPAAAAHGAPVDAALGASVDGAPGQTLAAAERTATPSLAEVAGRFVREHRDRLMRARSRGPVAIWGGAGKGALFAVLVDPDRALVDFVIDIHPSKQGFFLPGAGHRVVAPKDAQRAAVRTIFVANATYVDEIAAQCNALGLRVDLECVGNRPHARTTSGRP